jgi:acyl-CoA dehydrogenase
MLFDMDQPGRHSQTDPPDQRLIPLLRDLFDNARAEKRNLVGEAGQGWTIAKYLLTHEREMISGFGTAPSKSLGETAMEHFGADEQGRLRQRHAARRYRPLSARRAGLRRDHGAGR